MSIPKLQKPKISPRTTNTKAFFDNVDISSIIFIAWNFHLSVELLLVGFHVHVTLQLGTCGSDLEAQSTISSTLVQLLQALHTAVLHGVLETSGKVGHKLVDGARFC